MRKGWIVLFYFFVSASAVWAQGGPGVDHSNHQDVSRPLTEIPPSPPDPGLNHRPTRRPGQLGPLSAQPDSVAQTSASPLVATTSGLNFAGVGNGDYGYTPNSEPPDTNGAVGATQFVQWVNTSFAVFDKTTGALLYGPAAGKTMWTGFGGGCETNNDGDPIVQYDKAANRWVFIQFSVTTLPYLECVAVSKTSDATGAYNRYSFSYGNVQFPDYMKLGVWPDAYYISFNVFNNSTTFAGPKVCAYDRAKMIAGLTATQVCFQLSTSADSLLPADLDGFTPPPAGSPNYYVNFGNNSLNLWKFHVDFVTPANSTLTGPTNIPVAAFSAACGGGGTCIPQSGTSQLLDSLADRLMYRLAYRNFGDHEALVVNHAVTSGTSVGVRWYELRNPAGTPTVFQQSTYAPDTNYRWMGSIAVDHSGNMALGYSVSSSSMNPAIRYTGRLVTDPVNTMQLENTITTGTGSQNGNISRWGDYTSMSVDPVDDCTFWYTNEYLKTSGSYNWSTRIASFKFPSCTSVVAPPSFTPPAGPFTSPQSVTISTATSGASIRYTTDGTIPTSSAGTLYNNTPIPVNSTLTLKAIAYKTGLTDSSVTSGAYTITVGGGNTAAFVATDAASQGNWKGVYGSNGYNVIGDSTSYPSYVSVTPTGQSSHTWAASTSDVRGLQKPLSLTDRIASTWYTFGTFTMDLNFTDGLQHQVAVYCLDWDSGGARAQTVNILDGSTNALLNSQSLSSFQNGKYLVWKLTGHVIIQITNTSQINAVVSGLFFDPATGSTTVAAPTFTPPAGPYASPQSVTINSFTSGASIRYTTDGTTIPTSSVGTLYNTNPPVSVNSTLTLKAIAYKTGLTDSSVTSGTYTITGGAGNTALFVTTDTTTQGSWKGVYGSNGYNVIDDTVSYPSYVAVTPSGQSNYVWTGSTSDVRGLQKALSPTDRIAATWYSFGTFTMDVNFSDGLQHQLALYCVDWDQGGARGQTVNILDGATNAVLNSQSLSNFQNGKYLVWKLTGHVIIQVTNTSQINAVVSGLFFDPATAGTTVAAPTFTPPAGSYAAAQSVMIGSATSGASIRYTTDGTTFPTSSVGTLYTNTPVPVNSNLTLKAIAYKTGLTDSSVTSGAYTITGGAGNTALFVTTDTATQGSWKGVYGAAGYNVINDTVSYPSYVTVTPTGQSNHTWAASTSDVRGLQKALSATDRIAATWYSFGTFTIDVNFTDGVLHQLALYCVDWDQGGARAQTVNILDGGTNAVLNSQNLSSFQNGKYLVWKLTGHVIIQVTNASQINAVVSGLFFN